MKFKLKYQDGATKKICMFLASTKRKKFGEALWAGKVNLSLKKNSIDFDVISFSGKRDFEEQVLSIYSFLFHVGQPEKWVIYSDGSYTADENEFFLKNFSFLKLKEWNDNKDLENNPLLKRYLETCHLSKKLNAILGHNYERQTMYIDSDILFYKKAFSYFNSDILKKGFWYAQDADSGSLKQGELHALNSGLLILNKDFNFNDVFEYLKNLNSNFEYFSEQSSFNHSFKKQYAQVLDPKQFVINLEDQFDFSMVIEASEMAVRHYVTPVRHKIWQKGWEWHFSN